MRRKMYSSSFFGHYSYPKYNWIHNIYFIPFIPQIRVIPFHCIPYIPIFFIPYIPKTIYQLHPKFKTLPSLNKFGGLIPDTMHEILNYFS